MKRIALTFIGKDRPGIIAEVSRILYRAGCNIEDTTMTILEGELAMILIANVPTQTSESSLRKSFQGLKRRWDLDCFSRGVSTKGLKAGKHPLRTKTYLVSVAGRDRTGIVYRTSQILARHKLNITDLNSKIVGKQGKPLFTMILEVDIPKRFSMERLELEWVRLRKELGVDMTVRALERLSL